MNRYIYLFSIALLASGCMSPGVRYGHSKEPVNLGGGQFLVEGYRLETGIERAKEYCSGKEMITINIMRPLDQWDWTKIAFICR